MDNTQLDIFKNMDFSPAVFMLSANQICSYQEFRDFGEGIIFEEYFQHKFQMDYEDKHITQTFLILAYTYFYFFNEFNLNNDLFQKNKKYITDRLLEDYDNYNQKKALIKINKENDLSKKWYGIISEAIKEDDNIDKINLINNIKYYFLQEYISFVMWFIETEPKMKITPKINSISLFGGSKSE